MKPLVSVVIPTFNRPQLVTKAVQSALAQTLKDIEVIVVVDGPESNTCNALAKIQDSRLRVIELYTNQGSRMARDIGVQAAKAEWVAFLDDDDEWMEQKLELQLESAKTSLCQFPIVSCYTKVRTHTKDFVWPRRIPHESEPLSEYLFVRNTFFQGEGLIQTSTIFTSKKLLQNVPFSNTVEARNGHDDWDWLLRVVQHEGVEIVFLQQVLSVWNLNQVRPSLSKGNNWRFSWDWIRSKRDLVTPRAYSSFILTEVSARASRNGDWSAFLPLMIEAIQFGKPQIKDIGVCLGMWFIRPNIRVWLRNMLFRLPLISA